MGIDFSGLHAGDASTERAGAIGRVALRRAGMARGDGAHGGEGIQNGGAGAERIGRERLKGFLMAPWLMTVERNREGLLKAVDIAAEAME